MTIELQTASASQKAAIGIDPYAKLKRVIERAITTNPVDLPVYGSGPTAGLTAPTVSYNATTRAANTKAYTFTDADTSYCAVLGGKATVTAAPYTQFGVVTSTEANLVGTTGKAGRAWAVEFMTDDPAPNIRLPWNNTYQVRISVDGQYLSKSPTLMPNNNAGGNQSIDILFGAYSAKGRHIRVEGEGPISFGSIFVKPDSRVWAPQYKDLCRAAIIGDSYDAYLTSSGTTNSFIHDCRGAMSMRLLGIQDYNLLSIVGTGFVYTAGGNLFGSSARMADLQALQTQAPLDLVVFRGSINDRSQSPAAVQAAAQAAYTAARAIVGPYVPIVQTGVSAAGMGSAAVLAIENALKAGVSAQADSRVLFTPFTTLTPLPAVDAYNSARYVQADNIHPNFGAAPSSDGGMEYHARTDVAGIRKALYAL